MIATLTQAEMKARRREYQRKYMSDPENRKRAYKQIYASIKRRYWRDAEFRETISNNNRAWREKNKGFDMLRKTIAAIYECGDEAIQARKNARLRAWKQKKTPSELAEFRKRQSKLSRAWHLRQLNDPEIGELFRATLRRVNGTFTQEMKDAAVAKYRAIMERRKEERRARRIEGLFMMVN